MFQDFARAVILIGGATQDWIENRSFEIGEITKFSHFSPSNPETVIVDFALSLSFPGKQFPPNMGFSV